MINKGTDNVVLVDLTDREIGLLDKALAHAKPCLHRAFSVFIHAEGKMLIQQRAIEKYHCGGIWANACCSHPRQGEATMAAALRRLEEETSIAQSDLVAGLQELFAFSYFAKFADDLFEYEYDHVFLGALPKACPIEAIAFDCAEIAQMKWVDFADLLADIKDWPEKYAPWFIVAAPLVIKELAI